MVSLGVFVMFLAVCQHAYGKTGNTVWLSKLPFGVCLEANGQPVSRLNYHTLAKGCSLIMKQQHRATGALVCSLTRKSRRVAVRRPWTAYECEYYPERLSTFGAVNRVSHLTVSTWVWSREDQRKSEDQETCREG